MAALAVDMLRSRLRAFLTYIAWETIAIHALTGLLFAAISFLLATVARAIRDQTRATPS